MRKLLPNYPARATVLAVLALAGASTILWPATRANAASLNQQSDRAALTAYRSYLSSLVADAPTAATRDGAFVAAVNTTCPGALTQESQDPDPTTALQTVLFNIGYEAGDDLTVEYLSVAHKPFNRLAAKLSGLSWTSSSAVTTVARFLAAERAMLSVSESNLCGDSLLLSTSTTTTPAKTKAFDQRFTTDTTDLDTALAGLISLFQRYQTTADKSTVKKINSLAARYAGLAEKAKSTSATTLLADLGDSTSSS